MQPLWVSLYKIQLGKALEIPLVNDAVEAATKHHNEAVAYPYVNQVETIIGGLITKAEDTITPCKFFLNCYF